MNLETPRYYERNGLVQLRLRSRWGYRVYDREAVRRVQFIKRRRELGLTLSEIASLTGLREETGQCAEVRPAAQARNVDIEERIRGLEGMRRALQLLLDSCESEARERHGSLLEDLEPEAG